MAKLTKSILNSVDAETLEVYMRKKKIFRNEEEQGIDVDYWINNLLEKQMIDTEDFETFLFDELFWGKRKNVRVYKLDKIRKIRYATDWLDRLQEKYDITSLDFSRILEVHPSNEEPRKIVAVHTEMNDKGELSRIRLLFVCQIRLSEKDSYADTGMYFPVELDFVKKIMIIKAWNRNGVLEKEDRSNSKMDYIYNLMSSEFGVYTKAYEIEHKEVLFRMSRQLIYDAYQNIPNYALIEETNELIDSFSNNVGGLLSLENSTVDDEGNFDVPIGLLDFKGEVKNVIESLIISDYFFNKKFEKIWEDGLEAVIAKIKFNDKEQVITSLNGENNDIPIFCTKTFMNLRKRIEETQKVESLSVLMGRKSAKGKLNVRYDTSNPNYIDILVQYGIKFSNDDLTLILEMYEKYESESIERTQRENKTAVS